MQSFKANSSVLNLKLLRLVVSVTLGLISFLRFKKEFHFQVSTIAALIPLLINCSLRTCLGDKELDLGCSPVSDYLNLDLPKIATLRSTSFKLIVL